ncbi:MAG: nuclear transport factor 2 family protein [Halieaceae bacterium]|nr:nuclear transport factor 2 family protein [Halieaceae bacterium]
MFSIKNNHLDITHFKNLAILLLGATFVINPLVAAEQQDIKEIEALYLNWKVAVEASDIDAYLSNLHDDIRLRPPAGDSVNGIDNYRRFLGPVFSSANYQIQVDNPPMVTVFGGTAIAEYDYTIQRSVVKSATVKLERGAISKNISPSSYVDFLRKREDGTWSVYLHTWRAQPSK